MARQKFSTKGQMEAAVSDMITRFEKEYMGRGPLETKTYIIDDMVITRLKGILTKAEIQLVHDNKNPKGRELIKQVRIELLENARPVLETMIRNITRRKVLSLYNDISTSCGEKIIIFTLDREPELNQGL